MLNTLTPQELEKRIIELYPTKIGIEEITRITGASRTKIWRTVKKHNLPLNRAKYNPQKTKEYVEFIRKNYSDFGGVYCAKHLNLSYRQVGLLANKYGIYRAYKTNDHSPVWSGYQEISGKILNSIKHGAKRRKIAWSVTPKEIWDLFLKQNRKCAMSGVDLKFPSNSTTPDGTASLDRINSTKGYVIDNVQWIHKDLNMMKQDWDDTGFIQWCHRVSEFNKASRPQISDNLIHVQ